MAVPAWFDYTVYFQNKLAQMQKAMPTYDALALKKAFADADYAYDAEGMYDHFVEFGNAENVAPNAFFDASQYLVAKTAHDLGKSVVTAEEVQNVANLIAKAGMTPWDHYLAYGSDEGVDPSNSFDEQAYLEDKLAQWNETEKPVVPYTMEDLKEALHNADMTPLTHYLAYGKGEGLSATAVDTPPSTGDETFYLTTGQDNLVGTAGNDVFQGYSFDNNKTLQTGDSIDGGAGTDTLYADVEATYTASPQYSAPIRPMVKNVEVLKFSVQNGHNYVDDGDNLVNGVSGFHVDADRIAASATADSNGKTQFWTTDSRADLVIEDVRIASNTVAVGMQNTDPGDVDLSVFFNAQYLKADAGSQTGSLDLRLIDIAGAMAKKPLESNTYDQINFDFNSTTYTLKIGDISGEAGYDDLLTAIQTALKTAYLYGTEDTVDLSAQLTAAINGTFNRIDPKGSGTTVTGDNITLTAAEGVLTTPSQGYGWVATKGVPPDSSLDTKMQQSVITDCPLIKTDIYLDNVGMVQWDDAQPACLPDDILFGSNSSDLVVGSMADRGGIERFDVTVDQGSWLSTMASTNETLRMVTVVNGDLNGDGVNSKGNLFIGDWMGEAGEANGTDALNPDNGLALWTDAARYLSTDGLKDVAVFDADKDGNTFQGDINLGASITASSFEKYLRDVDTTNTTYYKDAPLSGYEGVFTYNFGSGDDTLNMTVNSGVAADRDFKMVIDGNAGDDQIQFAFDDGLTTQVGGRGYFATPNQLEDQQALMNVVINGGEGDDTIELPGEGNVIVNGDAGDDVIYTDNTGGHAVWVLNAARDADGVLIAGARDIYVTNVKGAQPLYNDIKGTNTGGLKLTGATVDSGDYVEVKVDFKGLISTAKISLTAKDTAVDGETVRQAIITAINDDAVLGHLLSAKDGAGYSLMVESLIDGVMRTFDEQNNPLSDLNITFAVKDSAGKDAGVTVSDNGAYTEEAFATYTYTYNGAEVVGADGKTDTDNVVNGGTGNDLIVLGTGINSEEVVEFDAAFGHDTIVNFKTGYYYPDSGSGVDMLDFYNLLGAKAANSNGLVEALSGSTATNSVVYSFSAKDAAAAQKKIADLGVDTSKAGNNVFLVTYEDDEVLDTYHVWSAVNGTSDKLGSIVDQGVITMAEVTVPTEIAVGEARFVPFEKGGTAEASTPQIFQGTAEAAADAATTLDGTATQVQLTTAMVDGATDPVSSPLAFKGTAPIADILLDDAKNDVNVADGNNANYNYTGGTGDDIFTDIAAAYTKSIDAGAGDDKFEVSGTLAKLTLDGGTGTDTLTLTLTADANLSAATLANIEVLDMGTATAVSMTAAQLDMFTSNLNAANYIITLTDTEDVTLADTLAADGMVLNLANVANDVTTDLLKAATTINGNAGVDEIDASAATGAMTLSGLAGDDILIGGKGNDTITGGVGADTMTGGAGADKFVFTANDSGKAAAHDVITDFVATGTADTLSLGVDGSATNTANATGIASYTAAITAADVVFGGTGSEIYYIGAGTTAGTYYLCWDSDGDNKTDDAIELTGVTGTLTYNDIVAA